MLLPAPVPEVIFQPLPEGGVLFHCGDEVYFGLNVVGTRVWQLLEPLQTLDELVDALVAEYPDVPPETLRADVAGILAHMKEHGVVREPSAAV